MPPFFQSVRMAGNGSSARAGLPLMRTTEPVSYTHLDVYKRQPQGWVIQRFHRSVKIIHIDMQDHSVHCAAFFTYSNIRSTCYFNYRTSVLSCQEENPSFSFLLFSLRTNCKLTVKELSSFLKNTESGSILKMNLQAARRSSP